MMCVTCSKFSAEVLGIDHKSLYRRVSVPISPLQLPEGREMCVCDPTNVT